LNPLVGVILGSGLNRFKDELESAKIISEDAGSFHNIQIVRGKIEGTETMLFSGRKHFYEGYSFDEILQNVKIAEEYGVKLLIVTNAAGGLNKNFRIADLMLINSHYNFLYRSISSHPSEMRMFDNALIKKVRQMALKKKIPLRTGSYCCAQGPAYETGSEIRFLNRLKIDAVGMSTVPELTYSASSVIRTIGLSCITNLLSENSSAITSHVEVVEAGELAYPRFSELLRTIISHTSELLN